MSQLKAHSAILGSTIQILDLKQVHSYIAWPNLPGLESCDSCCEGHPRFKRKPQSCTKRGNTNLANQANHLFSEKLANREVFNNWFKKFVESDDRSMNENMS